MAFVRGAMAYENQRLYVESMVEFCHALDVRVIAERVANAEEHAGAIALGFDGFQGYFIGKPQP